MLNNISNTTNKTNKFVSTNQDSQNPSNIVFIDPRVDNFNSLISGLKANVEAVILDSTKDGIEQITQFLKGRTGSVDSVQILSHGGAGNLQLGSTQLNSETLGKYQQSLQQWFSPLLNKTPDLLLYGCDVASGEMGESFMQKLSQFTGADVAASIDLTGNAAKGGNWILEKATGVIEAGQAFTRKVRDAYQNILANPPLIVTNTDDSGAGSLRQAILDANAAGGEDTINFSIGLGGPQTIRVGSTTGLPLPYINDRVTIDGKTQPGFTDTNTPIIVLDGTAVGGATPNLDGLRFVRASVATPVFPVYGGPITSGDSSNSVVQGLVISNFSGSGIKLGHSDVYTASLSPTNIIIRENYIGTDITGTVAKPTSTWGDPNNTHALHVYGSTNSQLRNNLVSGNFTSTVVVRGSSSGTIIDGNKVGTDVTGRFALANQRWGLYIISGSGHTVTNNLVAANGLQDDGSGLPGVDVRVAGSVTGNTVGTDITGTYSLNNRSGFTFSGPTASAVNGNVIQGGATASIVPFNTIRTFPSFVTPTLTPGSPFLSAISQNNTNNNGTLVKDIVGTSIGNYAPVPTPGIAITDRDNSKGIWQYSTDNGFSWANVNLNFPTTVAGGYNVWFNSGYPAPNNPAVAPDVVGALLLSADDKNRIRFVPNAGYTGTTNSITYGGWNQRFGGNGEMINISGYARSAGSMQVITNNMSINSNTAQIEVLPINTAPDLVPNLVQPTNMFATAIKTTAGVVIGTVLATSVTDPDAGSQKGVAITKLDNANGTWQYSITDAANFTSGISSSLWIPIDSATVSETSALLLDSKAKLRFIPNTGFMGDPETATFRAWDQTNGTNGNRVDTTANGGATSVSKLDVNILNFAPVLAPGAVPTTKNQVDAIDGILVSDFAATAITDGNLTNLKGLAITDAPSTDGVWQYSIDSGTSWINIGAVSPTNALLLDIGNKIRFVPSVNAAFSKDISFRAWDQTKGTPGTRLDVGINGGSTSFSNQLATLTINVPIDPTKIPAAPIPVPPNNTSIDPSLFPLLRNPPAPETPSAVVVGTAPTPEQPSGNMAGGNTDCSCDQVIAQQQPNLVSDTIWGTNEADLLVTTSTANTVYGYQGNDAIVGTIGSENLFGGAGNDGIRGARGRDFIRGGSGDDVLYGGRGKDVVKGGRNKDLIFGGRGADMLAGGKGSDVIYGGRGNDFIAGGKGKDRLFGGLGDDSLCGCAGDDFLRGGRGNDTLNGEKGNDVLVGGLGDDTLTGGAGSDRFRLVANNGVDTITDFEAGVDFLELARGLQLSDLQIVQGTGATVIGLQPGSLFASDRPLAVLLGVNAASLTPNSFVTV